MYISFLLNLTTSHISHARNVGFVPVCNTTTALSWKGIVSGHLCVTRQWLPSLNKVQSPSENWWSLLFYKKKKKKGFDHRISTLLPPGWKMGGNQYLRKKRHVISNLKWKGRKKKNNFFDKLFRLAAMWCSNSCGRLSVTRWKLCVEGTKFNVIKSPSIKG